VALCSTDAHVAGVIPGMSVAPKVIVADVHLIHIPMLAFNASTLLSNCS